MNNINQVISELNNAHNEGLDYDINELSEKHDVPIETIIDFEKMLKKKTTNLFNFNDGLEGYTSPPPVIRMTFQSPFSKSDFFDFNWNSETESLIELQLKQLKKNNISYKNYHYAITEDYEKIWCTTDPLILQYSIYILLKVGQNFQNASSYAKEFLTLFGHLFFKSKNNKKIDLFINDYIKNLIIGILLKYGLIEVDNIQLDRDNINFKIRTTKLFNEWIKIKADS